MRSSISLRAVLVLSVAMAILGLAAAPAAWGAVPVTITNAGFENPVLGEGVWQSTIPSWSHGWYNLGAPDPNAWVAGNMPVDIGVYNVNVNGTDEYTSGLAPEGQNMAFVDGYAGYDYGINQVLLGRTSALQADATYVLSATVGNPFLYNGDLAPNYRIELVAGGVVLKSATGASPVDDTTWAFPSLTYNSGATPAKLGQQLEIRLIAVNDARDDGYEVDFDAVSLLATYTHPISDPDGSYTVIGGTGSLSLTGTGSLPSDGSSLSLYEWDLNNDGTFGDAVGATPGAISYADLTTTWGMTKGNNTVGLRVTDATTAETAVATTTVTLIGVTTPKATVWDIAPGTVGAGNGSITGGNGTWNTTNGNWTTDGGANNVAWVNANNDIAVFGGTAGTVTLGDGITVGGLRFETSGYTISDGGNALISLSFSAADNTIAFSDIISTAQTATITGGVVGTGNVTFLTPAQIASSATLTFNGTIGGAWSGATTINTRTTMALAAGSQVLLSTSGLTLNGGSITLTNADSDEEKALDRVSDIATITSNGGTITYTTTNAASTRDFGEAVGAVLLNSGQLNIVQTLNKTAGSQALTLSGLTPSGSSAVTFSSPAFNAFNMIKVTGAGATPAGQIIDPRATTGTTAAAQTDYAKYDASANVVPANIAASGEGTWMTATDAYTVSGGATLSGSRTIAALRATGTAQTLALGASNLETYGILNGGTGLLTISGTGALRVPAGGSRRLFLTTGNNAITISAPITNSSDSQAVTLVKSGSGTLTLSSTTSNYSGGTVINAGILLVSATANLSSGGITFNGSATIQASNGGLNGAWPITLNNGAIATFTGQAANWDYQFYTTGAVTGSGGVYSVSSGGAAGSPALRLLSTDNTFTGPIYIGSSTRNGLVLVNSLADSASPIVFGYGTAQNGFRTGCHFVYYTGATADLVLNQRYFVLSGVASPANGILNDSGKALTVNTDLRVTGTGSINLSLGGTGAGLSTFAGKIADGPGAVVNLAKAESGTWVLYGANTYTGGTTVSAGTLKANAAGTLSTGNVTVTGGTLVIGAADAMADTAALRLPSATTKNLTMNANDTIASLLLAGVQQPTGAYASSGLGSAWMNAGPGILTVGSAATQPLYWDLNDANAGAGGATPTGNWADANWNTVPDGTGSTAAWTAGRTAAFSAGTDASGTYAITVTGTQDIGGLTFEEGTVTLSGGTALRMTANSVAYVNTGRTATIAMPITDDGTARALTKSGAGTLVLSGANAYTGATTLSQGTLRLADANAISASSGLSLANGTTLQLRSDTAATFTTPLCTLTSGATTTIDVNNNGSGSGNTLTLSGGIVTGTNVTGSINVTGGNGYTLRIPTVTQTAGTLTFNPTTANLSLGPVTINSTGGDLSIILDGTSTGNSVESIIEPGTPGTLSLVTKQGTGTWTAGSITSRKGMNITAGKLIVNGTLWQNKNDRTITLSGASTELHLNNAAAVRNQPSATVKALTISAGKLDNSSGAAITTSTYDPTMAWNGDFTFIGSNGANSNLYLGTGAVALNATRTVTVQNAATTLTVGGVISGTNFGITKAGPGTLELNGVNTYTGATNVNAGTLGGKGTIAGTVAVNANAALAPGSIVDVNGPAGTMTIGTVAAPKSLTMAADSLYEWELGSAAADKVAVYGDLTLTSGWKLKLIDAGGTPTGEYDLFTYTGSFSGTINAVIDPTGDWTSVTISQEVGRIYLSLGKPGDTNGDFVVDAADFITLKKNFGAGPGATGKEAIGDFNDSGTVDWADLNTLTGNIGSGSGAPQTAPEPATLGLLAIGALAVIRRNRRS